MGGVQHACLDFRLFDKVNKLDDSSLLSLYVLRKNHWLDVFFGRVDSSYAIFQRLPIPKQIIGFVFQSFFPSLSFS